MEPRPPKIIDFSNDIFHDKDLCESLSELAMHSEHGLVVSLESDWGNGKTTFANRWMEYLNKREWQNLEMGYETPEININIVYVDTFEKDYREDPFESIFKAILKVVKDKKNDISSELQEALLCAGKNIVRRSISFALRKIPGCGGEIASITDDIIDGVIERHFDDAESDPVAKFKFELNNAISNIRKTTGMPLIIILDELDRCRPDYAVKMLESIKHLYDNDNIFFLLAINKQQLESAIKGVYGNDTDAATYLNKFIDVTCFLPNRSTSIEGKAGYILSLLSSNIFQDGRIDTNNTTFTVIKELIATKNIRDIYKYIQQLSLFIREIKGNTPYCYFPLIAVYLKMYNHEFFNKILVSEISDHNEIAKYALDTSKIPITNTEDHEIYNTAINSLFNNTIMGDDPAHLYAKFRNICKRIVYLQKN